MIDTTKDIFWLVAALSFGVFTFFLCWTFYYINMMLRDARKVVGSVREKIEVVDKILNLVKDKLEKTSTHISLIADSILKVVSYLIDKHEKPSKKRRKDEE